MSGFGISTIEAMSWLTRRFLYAREDQLFWLELTTYEPIVAFSMAPECYGGLGANLFYGTKWGTDKALKMLYCDIMYRKEILNKYASSDKLRLHTEGMLRQSRCGFASSENRGLERGRV